MEFTLRVARPEKLKTACIAVPVFAQGKLGEHAQTLDKAWDGLISTLLQGADIEGKPGEACLIPLPAGVPARRLLVIGCGKPEEFSESTFRKVMQKLGQTIRGSKAADLTLLAEDFILGSRDIAWSVRQSCELIGAATYVFNELKSKDKQTFVTLTKCQFVLTDKSRLKAADRAVHEGQALADAMALARTLGNLPGNLCPPSRLATEARKLAKSNPAVKVRVLEEKDMAALGMGAFLSVTAGSAQPAKLIAIEFMNGRKTDRPQVLVGKGITFDTGGISLKPGPDMDQMKFDMCGAASVLATLQAAIAMDLKLNIVGVLACAENMPSGTATRPGDIVTTMSGQTVEILNTDAEGRLVLCDTLTWVERYKPAAVIDVATLTGACIVALGKEVSGMLSNQDALADQLRAASVTSQDKLWQLPLWDEYQKQLDSPFADIANIGGPAAGTITAGCFLSRFTRNYPWAHLDIAGVAWVSAGPEKGATGRPVPLLVEYLRQRAGA